MNENSQRTPWYRQAVAAMSTHVYLKSIGTMLFIGLFFGAYFYVLERPGYTTTVMPITLLDRLIGFQPGLVLMGYGECQKVQKRLCPYGFGSYIHNEIRRLDRPNSTVVDFDRFDEVGYRLRQIKIDTSVRRLAGAELGRARA